jgi:hypothetical protein
MRIVDAAKPVPLMAGLLVALLVVMLSLILVNGVAADTAKNDNDNGYGDKIVIHSRNGGKLGVTKAELSRRPKSAGGEALPSRRALPTATDPYPTILKLTFPTLVEPGQEVNAVLKFNDPDDYVFGIFATVFYPDGDVASVPLYYYPDDGGDIWKGTIHFYVEMPESETPLTGRIVITCSDEYLNVSEISQTFALIY